MTRKRKLITVHIDRTRAKQIVHHPAIRLMLFMGLVCCSVFLVDTFTRSHYAATHIGAVGVGSFVARGLEIITDVICDRVFPV